MVIKDISKIEKNHSDGIKIKNLTLKIENKTVFSDKIDNEWRYLNNYIKVLEKIRNTINR